MTKIENENKNNTLEEVSRVSILRTNLSYVQMWTDYKLQMMSNKNREDSKWMRRNYFAEWNKLMFILLSLI